MPGLKAHKKGKQIILTTGDIAAKAILATLSFDNEDDGKYMVNVAKRVRSDLFKEKKAFDGRFNKESQHRSVPDSLLMLLQIILEGTNIIASKTTTREETLLYK